VNHPMGPPAMGDNTATDQRVPAALTIANLEFLLRVLLPGSAVETNTNYLEIECRLATRGRGGRGRPRASNHANLRPAKPRLFPLRTVGRIWKSGGSRGPGWGQLRDCHQTRDPMPAVRGKLYGFPKTVRWVLFALAARPPSAAKSTAPQTLSRNRPGPFRGVPAPLFHDQPEKNTS
jgi:hypothetical protein